MRRPPYAPFRTGAPEFIVGLKPIALEAWLKPDPEAHAIQEKRDLLTTKREEVHRARPEALATERELEALVTEALGPANAFDDPSPLVRASARVSDDLVLLARDGDEWRVIALTLCSPTFFSAAHAFDKSLWGLHGPVPDKLGADGTQALAPRIGRMFDNLRDGLVLERFNWTVQAGPERYTPDGAPLRARAEAAAENEALDLLHLRVERQTVRLLPQTGAVLFTIRISLDPLRAVFAEEGAREDFAKAWENAPAHVRGYKKWAAYERLVRAALR